MIRAGDSIENPVTGERIVFRQTSRETNGAARFWNAGDEVAHFVCEIRPALQFESLLETMFALAADGRTNRKGMPNPLHLAVIAQAHFDTVRLPFPPAVVQRIGIALGSLLGRALGYEPSYVPSPAPIGVPTATAAV